MTKSNSKGTQVSFYWPFSWEMERAPCMIFQEYTYLLNTDLERRQSSNRKSAIDVCGVRVGLVSLGGLAQLSLTNKHQAQYCFQIY